MAKYCGGDARAFHQLYLVVAPRLLGYLVKLARDRSAADDLLQLTFMKVHRARSAYIVGADPLPWIYSIAHRSFIDHARKMQRAAKTFVHTSQHVQPDPDIPGEADGESGDNDQAMLTSTLDALAQLPRVQREAIVLIKLEGKTVSEAAEIAGTTVGAMRVRAHRGYVALRVALEHGPPTEDLEERAP